MSLPAHLQYLDPLLDVIVEMVIADLRAGINKDADESGQEQRRREVQADARLPRPDSRASNIAS